MTDGIHPKIRGSSQLNGYNNEYQSVPVLLDVVSDSDLHTCRSFSYDTRSVAYICVTVYLF